MKRFAWYWLAVSSVLLATMAHAETRPQYGGTLHVAMRAAPMSLDPADGSSPDSFAQRSLTSLLFDTLVTRDDAGRAKPSLAESWQSSHGNQRWQFRLRPGVKFSDGTPLTSEIVASSLRLANSSWKVRADGDSVMIENDGAELEMLAELAVPRNAIVKRDGVDKLAGTGPFRVVEWQPGKKLTLAAEEECWRGRPFLDAVELEMGRSYRDQITSLESGKSDLVEVAPEQSHHFSPARERILSSAPIELLALLFTRDAASADEKALREALPLTVERGSMHSVLLQGAGQPAGTLLPTWISGYGFVFPLQADLTKARQLHDQAQNARIWTLGYDNNDPISRLLAERIALNARDARLSVVPTGAGMTDLQLVRIPLASPDPWIALKGLAARTGLPRTENKGNSIEDLFRAEQAALATQRVIPLFHLPVFYASAARLKDWAIRSDGGLELTNAWLEGAEP